MHASYVDPVRDHTLTAAIFKKTKQDEFRHSNAEEIVDGVTDQALLAALPRDKPRQRSRWLLFSLIGILIGIAGDRLLVAPTRTADIASRSQETKAATPAFSRVGDRIIVPETSPLRTLLTVAADRKSTRLNSSHPSKSRMPSSA